ncbi:universal stress protein [Halalkalibacillus sediminis]|uniref:Universal stress protein n=1 Tax=Halalkalibacillus sediminis TaxID=2018042 RepID=A0A2I0QTD8_9BACI|nr:universal stress protein [Halalkalibacillus sediminis]PKR77615.1 universal stress protein [Halalkalibacillus sediminis]
MYKRVLVAADGSEHSFRATEHAIGLLERDNPESVIEVVYSISPSKSKADVLHTGDKDMIAKKRRERLKDIEGLLEEKKIPYEVVILQGEPGPTIVEYANGHMFDCVVLGSRGRNNLQSMVLGSVSHKVAKRVNCPVMIVK